MRSIEKEKNILSRPTIRSTTELARELGLSRWTVSRVINGHDGVHPDTVERVRAAMREHGFAPNPLAQGLRRGRTNIIGVCVPEIEDFYLGPKLESLRCAVAEEGFHLMIGMSDGRAATEIETLDRLRLLCAAGIVTFASRLPATSVAITRLREANIPFLMVDPVISEAEIHLGIDRAQGMREATRHLIDLGHRHLATLGIDGETEYTRARLEGIRETLGNATLRQTPLPRATSYYEGGRLGARSLSLTSKRRPTGVLALNDRVAMGLIEGLREACIRVPEEISVIGYDNMEAGNYISPKLTTIDPCPGALMTQIARRLLQMICGEGLQDHTPFYSPTRLIIRESTCKRLG